MQRLVSDPILFTGVDCTQVTVAVAESTMVWRLVEGGLNTHMMAVAVQTVY